MQNVILSFQLLRSLAEDVWTRTVLMLSALAVRRCCLKRKLAWCTHSRWESEELLPLIFWKWNYVEYYSLICSHPVSSLFPVHLPLQLSPFLRWRKMINHELHEIKPCNIRFNEVIFVRINDGKLFTSKSSTDLVIWLFDINKSDCTDCI